MSPAPRWGPRRLVSRAVRSPKRSSEPRAANCLAPHWRNCRWSRAILPIWQSRSTRRRCLSIAPPGPRISARRGEHAKHALRNSKRAEAAMPKLYATEAAQRVIDAAVQIHGGDGVRYGHPVEALYREIRALRIYEGASDVQKIIIARSTLSSGGDG